ncbi:hypothetical protein BZG36_01761 [Bifiguratus adelaidae]|uniref:Cyclin N-terminal domain-containing protein n=1 Tax=Bifiguratus adelaidae TaxID=1938954 RepID=A0A261Y383_9FUNG|nr:hypothetical protein BZG36_01761 [Bifiguratus adelaidae]
MLFIDRAQNVDTTSYSANLNSAFSLVSALQSNAKETSVAAGSNALPSFPIRTKAPSDPFLYSLATSKTLPRHDTTHSTSASLLPHDKLDLRRPSEPSPFGSRRSRSSGYPHVTVKPSVSHTSMSQSNKCSTIKTNSSQGQAPSIYVDVLIEIASQIINSIWHHPDIHRLRAKSATASATGMAAHAAKLVPLRQYIQEVLRRSKTTYATLQVALFYLYRIKSMVIERLTKFFGGARDASATPDDYLLCCGRRVFLAALIVASKFLQDRNFKNHAWAKIAGLDVSEVNRTERLFLQIIDYRTFIQKETFDKWVSLVNGCVGAVLKDWAEKRRLQSGFEASTVSTLPAETGVQCTGKTTMDGMPHATIPDQAQPHFMAQCPRERRLSGFRSVRGYPTPSPVSPVPRITTTTLEQPTVSLQAPKLQAHNLTPPNAPISQSLSTPDSTPGLYDDLTLSPSPSPNKRKASDQATDSNKHFKYSTSI